MTTDKIFGGFRFVRLLLLGGIFFLTGSGVCSARQLALTPFKASGIYSVGEKLGWTITLPKGTTAPESEYRYTIKKNNQDVIKTGRIEVAALPATIETKVDEPAMVYVEISAAGDQAPAGEKGTGKHGAGGHMAAGAAVAPERLQPSVPRPAGFDQFWESKIKLLKEIPENAVLTAKDSGRPGVEYATIRMDHINGTHVYGQIAKPTREGKFPALVIFQWASPPYPLQKQWVTDRAAEGWLALNIEPHDVLPDQPPSYYSALPAELKNYQAIGRDDRDKNYFLQMYLADYRAVEYMASRPDWNGKTLVVMGTSMGGQQSLSVAGLDEKITHVIVNEPAGCDSNGPLHGRASGYPNWPSNNPKIMETALYFDAVNFASHIKATSLVAMGFVDTTAPPVGIWTAFNQIRGPKEAVPMIDSPHNHLATPAEQFPYTSRSAEWLDTLVKGGEVKPNSDLNRSWASRLEGQDRADHAGGYSPAADQPSPRTDQNSQLAHTELLQKARSGRIDVYFEGDSITRRWGASDDQYKDFLVNWNQNFFGWNAADFGWGGDKTQNILWRLENGELDNINPKIIVLLAGTNNIGNRAPRDEDAKIADVTRGIKAILDVCQQKAPKATIVLMGITPRNDNMAVMSIINRVNENIAKFADGKTIRYVNINESLADKEGKLLEGMTVPDRLHLDVKGYQIWADALKPIFTELLGPPAKEDHAPPLTGDPSARKHPATKPS
ncbi:MAG TPA: acetylxylan esterase [Blastocatellia bacterium]|nr:acetylxylan esterase [Blastocatellia bacterium]